MHVIPRLPSLPSGLRRRAAALLAAAAGVALGLALGVALLPATARAAHATGTARRLAPLPLTVTMVSDTALTLDSNKPFEGPHAQYVAFRITNTSGAQVSNLTATISGFSGGMTLQSGQPAAQYIGSLAAGASRTVYWFVAYPSTYNLRSVLTVQVTDGAGNDASGTAPVRTLAMLSAQAGGLASSSSIGAGAVIGQLIPLDVTFTFRGWNAGDTFNMQPAGNTEFPAGCFQLVSSTIISAQGALATVMPPGTQDRQYFTASIASPGGGSTWDVQIRYWFKYLCAGATGTPLPYSNGLSGTQLKYSSSYGTGGGNPGPIPPAPSPSATFTVAKTASVAQLPTGGTVTYTVAITNVSTFAVTVDSIQDVLPAGATYTGVTAASQVNAANSGAMPAAGSTGTVTWRGNPGVSYAIAAGGTINLVYTVTLPATAGEYANSARPYVGPTLVGTATSTVTVGTADVSMTKTGPASAIAGDTVRYVLRASNAGPATAFRVTVRDALPAGMTFVSATRGGTLSGGVVTWPAIASLAAGASVTDTVTVLAPATLGSVTNVASSTAGTFDPAAANNDGTAAATRVTSTVTTPVSVTPDGLATPLLRLPASRSSQVFTVQNLGPVGATYALVARPTALGTPSVFLTVDSIRGANLTTTGRADSVRVTMAARATATYTVFYRVAAGDTALNLQHLRARNVATTTYTDTGWVEIRRTFPALTIAKAVTPDTGIRPGLDLTYTVNFSNAGEFAAEQVVVTDQVPAQVMFRLGSLTQALPVGLGTTVSYSSNGGTTWTYVPVSQGCGAPAGYDACVNRIRWTVTGGTLAPATPAQVRFVAMVR